jgi:hyperosmotically inducible periplasmic protein
LLPWHGGCKRAALIQEVSLKKAKTAKAVGAVVIGLSLAAGTALAAEAPRASSDPANRSFARADTNRDGFLSREEWRRYSGGNDKVFDESDDNRDGRLDPDEFVKASSYAQRVRAASYVEDSVLSAKVKAALLKELRTLSVNVDSHQGQVLLSGFVADEAVMNKALRVASSVDGVVQVRNGMVVK